MPITYNSVTLELKLLPLVLNSDDTAIITVRKGFTEAGVFRTIEEHTIGIPASDVGQFLDMEPTVGLSRRNDLSLAIYAYLVSKGLVEAGTIS